MGLKGNVQNIQCGGALNALSLSPDGRSVVVVGREVLKIIEVTEDGMEEKHNLRVGKVNLNYSSVDVKWHPEEQQRFHIATAATNGAVVIWNISQHGPQKQEKVIHDHTRTVNSISWHPEHAYTLLSGSQDGTMKLWDIRDPSNCKVTFDGKSESVRYVGFSPHYPNYFAAGFDNGTILLWDIRKNSSYDRKITAHQGPVFSIDWHPQNRSILASGGRDKFIQVWDLNAPNNTKPSRTIQTVSSVSRCRWRPGYDSQIGSSALVDSKIFVWDKERPYIPCLSFEGHTDIVTDILWPKHEEIASGIFSCGKDGFLRFQTVSEAESPIQNVRSVCLAWNPRDELSVVRERVDRQEQSLLDSHSNGTHSFFSFNPPPFLSDGMFPFKKRAIYTYSHLNEEQLDELNGPSYNPTVWKELAEGYRFTNDTLPALCDHNAQVADSLGQSETGQTWRLLRLFFEHEPSGPRNTYRKPSVISTPSTSSPASPNTSLPTSPVSSYKQSYFPDSLTTIFDSSTMQMASSPSKEPFNFDDLLSSDISLPLAPLPFSLEEDRTGLPPPPPPPPQVERSPLLSKKGLPRKFPLLFSDELKWDPRPIVEDMLEYYAENGDVQSAVVMTFVLGDRISIPKIRLTQWSATYIEILQRLQLWNSATEIISHSKDFSVRSMNQKSTTVHTSCSNCNKPLTSLGWHCESCKKQTNPCSICHQHVRGMYVWCQGCGHGGHLQHITTWFETEKFCPSGCGHLCNYRGRRSRLHRSGSVSSVESN